MSIEQIERRIEFIIEQRSKFVEDFAIARLERHTLENRTNIARLADVMLSQTNLVQRHDEQIAAVVETSKTPTDDSRKPTLD